MTNGLPSLSLSKRRGRKLGRTLLSMTLGSFDQVWESTLCRSGSGSLKTWLSERHIEKNVMFYSLEQEEHLPREIGVG